LAELSQRNFLLKEAEHRRPEVADLLDGRVATQITGADEGPIEVEHSGAFDLSRLTEDELRALEAIAERVAGDEGNGND
jgi:hypothetical protein